ncbi:class I adenylate-forming enzyme family protein [Halalkalicoccus salilacus]|uniref:class I adenylate-forming enzyme family protein n=1 Tax=Halalkalicoccus salilacus TaxID=3117459 RepID=UPI00300F74BB
MTRNHNELPAIKDLSAHNAEKSTNSIAYKDLTESITWSEFERRSVRTANGYQEYANKGDRVAFYCSSSIQHTVMLNGAMKAGCIVTNLHTNTSSHDLQYSIQKIRPQVIVVDEELAESFNEKITTEALQSVSTVVVLGEATYEYEESVEQFLAGQSISEPDVLVEEDDIVVIGWTSGSTGRPKGWCHTNRTMYLKGMELGSRPGFDRTGMVLTVNQPSFLIWFSLFTKTALGCEGTYYLSDWDPQRWLTVVEKENITQSTLVPTMWREVLNSDPEEYNLDSLRSIQSTGEKLNPSTLRQLRDRICSNISQTYGSTEIHSTVLYNDELTEERIESVGKPQAGTQVRIVEQGSDSLVEKPPNELGEIVVKAPDAPVWVWGDTEKTRESFQDGWWLSGDIGYKDEEGYLYIEGRADFMIKSKGVKIAPAPIEETLTNHPKVKDAIVVGIEDEEYNQKITAIVHPATNNIRTEELDEWCRESDLVANHARPREYRFVEEIERTPSGKLDRRGTMQSLGLDNH